MVLTGVGIGQDDAVAAYFEERTWSTHCCGRQRHWSVSLLTCSGDLVTDKIVSMLMRP